MLDPTASARATRASRLLLALALAATTAACATARPVSSPSQHDGLEPGGLVLTSDDILQLGARDAMEAVERAPTHLNIQRVRAGNPVRITQRGVSSFYLNPEILVVVDGSRVSSSVRHLENIPAESIRFIQILTSREAVMKWGAEAGNGVILVMTSARR
ncbi:MAG TPA: TonB-dependent receptor plug domain-containing protein [Longimicrobiales bacterium]|nr:TonB-dependent receptor plug domain-containing protein [Longimicrobiales bacterium]